MHYKHKYLTMYTAMSPQFYREAASICAYALHFISGHKHDHIQG